MLQVRDITGLILAGGRGSRMGGVDKGLQLYRGVPLALHAMRRLAPQVAGVMVNANRHREVYESMGMLIQPDRDPDFAGPLAGILAGLEHCATPYLVAVPCDAPFFPLDLVRRLGESLSDEGAEIATAVTTHGEISTRQPVFCLINTGLKRDLQQAVAAGHGKVDSWTARHRRVDVHFADPSAFTNVNTLQELRRLQTSD